jgi:ribulose kinase
MSMSPLLCGIDFGTQSVRCSIFDAKGILQTYKEHPYETISPSSGLAEQRPENWIEGLDAVMNGCYEEIGDKFQRIIGITCCTTASTVLMIGKDDEAMGNAHIWMDNRSAPQACRINATNHEVLRYCGGEDSIEWLVPKALWFKENREADYMKAARIVEFIDYIDHFLTGRWCASISQATGKSNYVEELGGFRQDFFAEIGLDSFLDKANTDIIMIGGEVGKIRPEIATRYRLSPETKVYQGGIDAFTSMPGLGVCRSGDTGLVMGTSIVLLSLTDKMFFDDRIWGPYKDAALPGKYCAEGGQISAGSIAKWFLREFDPHGWAGYGKMSEEAKSVPPGCDGLCCLDFFRGNRTPYKDPVSRGCFYGLDLVHTRAHIYRSILESVAFGTRNTLDVITRGDADIKMLRGAGGITKDSFWLQIIADVTGKPIALTEQAENSGTLGCAMVAAVGSGVYDSFEEACDAIIRTTGIVTPNAGLADAYDEYFSRYLDLYNSLKNM